MPYPPRKSTGRGLRGALLIWGGLFAIILSFSFVYAGTEYITFPYDNGKTGTAFLYRSPTSLTRPAPVILFFHGYNNLKTYEFRLMEFTRRGWDVLSVDLPGHGTNQNEFASGCWKVVFGALDYIQSRPAVWNSSAIGVLGHSFGGLVSAMGLLLDNRIAAGVLWAPLLNMTGLQGRADTLFPQGHPFDRFSTVDSPVTYLQSGRTLNNTLIIQGDKDVSIPIAETLNAYHVLEVNDPLNETRHSLATIQGADHLLYGDPVIRDTIAWFAPYLEPERANSLIAEVETSPTIYRVYFALEILALFGLFQGVFIIIVDQVGKSIERQRWDAELALGIERDEYPLPTAAINRNWKWHFIAYIVALIFIIYAGISLLEFLPFQFQMGFMGFFLTGTVFFYEYLRHRWTMRKMKVPKRVEEAEDLADDLMDPWPRRVRRYSKGVMLGLTLGSAYLLGTYALTFIFGFLFTFPVSALYFVGSIPAAFIFSLGIEWLFRRRIQTLIDQVKPYKKQRIIKILNFLLIVILSAAISMGFVWFTTSHIPAIYLLFYFVAGLCPVINWYLFDHTHSLIPTVTFSTLVMGWILSACLTPFFY